MKVRKYIRILHRDIGYIAFGLTIIYSLSGIAVNHIRDWNPNYIITNDTLHFNAVSDTIQTSDAAKYIETQLCISDSLTGLFRRKPNLVELFYEGKSISANLLSGNAIVETTEKRRVFSESNFLHLNKPKKLWTYIADLFALALTFLAISGLFMIKGKKGFKGRGKWFTSIGIVIPIIFLILYYS